MAVRLTADQINIIRESVARIFGTSARVWLFGSRVDDTKRGGDIDLLIETDESVPNRIDKLCRLEAALIMRLGDRKLDVVLQDRTTPVSRIHEIAKRTGVRL